MQNMTPSVHVLIILSTVVMLWVYVHYYIVDLPFCEGLTDTSMGIVAGREAC